MVDYSGGGGGGGVGSKRRGASGSSTRNYVPLVLVGVMCFLAFHYVTNASRVGTALLEHTTGRPDDIERLTVSMAIKDGIQAQSSSAPAAALLRSNTPELPPRPASSISPSDLKGLRSLLASREKDLARYQYEVPEEFFPTDIRTPYGVVEDNHQVVDSVCPRYVTMEHPLHGMGHQIGTYTTGLIISLFFNLTYVTGGFKDDSWHGKYPDIGQFTGLTEGELLLKDIEGKVGEVINIDSQPTNPFSENLQELYEPLRKSFLEEHKDKCNVLFKVKEFYSYDYGSFTRWIMARKFLHAPHREPIQLVYDPNQFIIGVHIRVGDVTPTPETFFVNVLSQVTRYLQTNSVPYHIHVFIDDQGPDKWPILAKAHEGHMTFHNKMSPFESFYHLTQADVEVMSASGFSQFSAILGNKALPFSPPSRESFPLKFCPPAAVCCDKEGHFEADGVVRLQWLIKRWLSTKDMRHEVTQLRDLIAKVERDQAATADKRKRP